ncbi:UDP-N-acetylmuramoyl-L-alanine--D-glutamate ligase [Vagococcus intermedius]|uniref:UDP-N-acetylmuramoylalanine--D-glutamate ligase n=1 Tax=Vagococcus intermedius TaxID=2991418 RepID=A0AAF0I6W4_9ENTE|nr:UDP-N-acetylmuramoyl-L-alanine--D-glutamate ligase [Vagococcus intermedius]WEG73858.1 UDP-N-acetylmuramoyl-L-alanine--D-glutamate ligase [Vagococcus intermedius]WEG75943.1 UDP-N-acetylmuramoyl-L-alanine--D-glutamate ligase [Vagococcus intermedius]
MKKVAMYENEKILVLGLARSGMSAARLLHQLGALVTVNDGKDFDENPEAQELLSMGIRVVAGGHPVELLDEEFTLVVKNPGIPYSNPILEKAIEKNIPIITEVELAYQIAEATIVGITGTNGKTTTTTMIGDILTAGLEKGTALLAGNIGAPASTIAQNAQAEDVLVTELSSFQLMGVRAFKPHIGVITNIYEAHLDYHSSRDEYVNAKWAMQQNMTKEDILIVNGNQPELKELARTTKAQVLYFSTSQEESASAYVAEDTIYYLGDKIMTTTELGVPGEHNIENALAAILVAKQFNISNETIKTALQHFGGVEHRTEFVTEIEGCKYYNDSKATNILATEKALSGFDNSKTILLAGGLDRGNDFDELVPSIKGLKGIVLYGESKYKLKEAADVSNITNIKVVNTLEEAVSEAVPMSTKGDAILLSPACASWDQYKNFEIRGNVFKEEVKKIKGKSE